MNGHHYSPVLVVALTTASVLAIGAMGLTVFRVLLDRLTGGHP